MIFQNACPQSSILIAWPVILSGRKESSFAEHTPVAHISARGVYPDSSEGGLKQLHALDVTNGNPDSPQGAPDGDSILVGGYRKGRVEESERDECQEDYQEYDEFSLVTKGCDAAYGKYGVYEYGQNQGEPAEFDF